MRDDVVKKVVDIYRHMDFHTGSMVRRSMRHELNKTHEAEREELLRHINNLPFKSDAQRLACLSEEFKALEAAHGWDNLEAAVDDLDAREKGKQGLLGQRDSTFLHKFFAP